MCVRFGSRMNSWIVLVVIITSAAAARPLPSMVGISRWLMIA